MKSALSDCFGCFKYLHFACCSRLFVLICFDFEFEFIFRSRISYSSSSSSSSLSSSSSPQQLSGSSSGCWCLRFSSWLALAKIESIEKSFAFISSRLLGTGGLLLVSLLFTKSLLKLSKVDDAEDIFEVFLFFSKLTGSY